MIKIEITSREVNERKGTSKDGNPFRIRAMTGYMHKSNEKYPQKIEINLRDEEAPYEVGMYELSDDSFFVGRFSSLMVRPDLKKIAGSAPATMTRKVG